MGEEIIRLRREKIESLRAAGVNPFPYSFERSHALKDVLANFDALEASGETVRVAGRVMLHRASGKLTFFHVEDMDARMQFSGRHDELGAEAYAHLKGLDIGDIIGAEAVAWRTKTGERTLGVQKMTLLTKSVRPLPEKHHGLKDKETRYRQRDLDWIMNADVRQVFATRARAISEIRRFMDGRGFLEVDVPYIQMTYGGGEARPFKTHINAISTDAYLSISPELFLKRYIVGGFDAVYSIARNFRNEGIDATHNPEFTMMECYWALEDYNGGMALFESLFESVFTAMLGTTKFEYQGQTIDVAGPWRRLPVYDGLREATGIDARAMTREELAAEIEKRTTDEPDLAAIDLAPGREKGYLVLDLFDHYVGDHLVEPTFVIDYPRETSPLCKVHREHDDLIERFEPVICGMEMGNAYSELNDPVLQRDLLEGQAEKLRAGLEEAQPFDEGFARAIEYGMPPTAGVGVGIDRMIMLLTGAISIRDVIAFPMLRHSAPQADDAPDADSNGAP
jgi:lysyl-tRNA synthetase class 2